ncbi:MAG: hypothetical protein AABW52_04045 [Nanoarchaeota archaeon]
MTDEKIQVQYVIPIMIDVPGTGRESTWSRVSVLAQRVESAFNYTGNLHGCKFGMYYDQDLRRDMYIFRALDEKVADDMRDILSRDEILSILPKRRVEVDISDRAA